MYICKPQAKVTPPQGNINVNYNYKYNVWLFGENIKQTQCVGLAYNKELGKYKDNTFFIHNLIIVLLCV